MTKIKFRSHKCMTPKGQFLSNLCRNNLHLISNTSKQKKKLSDKRIFFWEHGMYILKTKKFFLNKINTLMFVQNKIHVSYKIQTYLV